jgi:endonuclease YncB( thermonuclease family)
MGLLRVRGTIALDQFWPRGKSDADTAVILVDVDAASFQFQESKSGPFRTTRAFEGTMVHGRQGPKAPVDEKGRLRVRLQGIDAPELHYRPSPLAKSVKDNLSDSKIAAYSAVNHEYRQHWAESATYALLLHLQEAKKDPLPCEVLSYVSEPTDVFDTYGRFVGDLEARIQGKDYNINRWLVEQGWVVPGIYDSMTHSEISTLKTAWKKGAGKKVGKALASSVGSLDFNLRYRSGKTLSPQLNADSGPVLFPKLYRRLVTWSCQKQAGITSLGFKQQVAAGSDQYRRLADYLSNGLGSKKYAFETIFSGSGNAFSLQPDNIVFVEDANSQLKKDGQIVRKWF